MELIELMVVRGAAGIFFSGRRDARCDARTTLLRERNSGIDGIDKTIGRPSSPQNVLACTQNPPFEAFFGLQKAPKVPKWLKKRPE